LAIMHVDLAGVFLDRVPEAFVPIESIATARSWAQAPPISDGASVHDAGLLSGRLGWTLGTGVSVGLAIGISRSPHSFGLDRCCARCCRRRRHRSPRRGRSVRFQSVGEAHDDVSLGHSATWPMRSMPLSARSTDPQLPLRGIRHCVSMPNMGSQDGVLDSPTDSVSLVRVESNSSLSPNSNIMPSTPGTVRAHSCADMSKSSTPSSGALTPVQGRVPVMKRRSRSLPDDLSKVSDCDFDFASPLTPVNPDPKPHHEEGAFVDTECSYAIAALLLNSTLKPGAFGEESSAAVVFWLLSCSGLLGAAPGALRGDTAVYGSLSSAAAIPAASAKLRPSPTSGSSSPSGRARLLGKGTPPGSSLRSLSLGSDAIAAVSPEGARVELSRGSLVSVFEAADLNSDGRLDRVELQEALRLVEERFELGSKLTSDDAERLTALLTLDGSGLLDEETFVQGVHQWLESVDGLGDVSVKQLQDILIYAFDRFDVNGDGRISAEEFEMALMGMDLKLSPAAVKRLHRLLDTNQDGYIDSSIDASDWRKASGLEKWTGAFQVAMQAQLKRKGLDKIVLLTEALNSAVQGAANPLEGAKRAFDTLFDFADQLADVADLSLDIVAVMVALNGIHNEICGVGQEADLQGLLPFLVASVTHVAEEVAESNVRNLTADEALVYVKAFRPHGFSMTEFRELLESGGAEWTSLPPGADIDSVRTNRLVMVARGSIGVKDPALAACDCLATLEPDVAIGETAYLSGKPLWLPGELVTCAEETMCVAWEFDKLRQCLEGKGNEMLASRMSGLLANSMQSNRKVVKVVRRRKKEQARVLEAENLQSAIQSKFGSGDVEGAQQVVNDAVKEHVESALERSEDGAEQLVLQQLASLLGLVSLEGQLTDSDVLSEILNDEDSGRVRGRAPNKMLRASQKPATPRGPDHIDLAKPSSPKGDMLHAAFDVADSDGDGEIDAGELLYALQSIDEHRGGSWQPTVEVANHLASRFSADGGHAGVVVGP